MLRTVGFYSILISVLCLRQEWYAAYHHVRRVHPFMLWGILGMAVFGLFLFLPCALCTLGVIGWASYLLWCSGLGSWWCAFFRFRSLGVGRFGYYLLDLGEDNRAVHNTVLLFLGWVFIFIFGLCVYRKPYMLAILRQPSLHGYYACLVFWANGALWRNCRLKQCEPSFSPFGVFLCSRYSLKRWWGKVLWLLWVGRARHPGPFSGSVSVEVFNVGGWLTHGDLALETEVDFLAVVEHRLVPARVGVSGLGFVLGVLLLFGPLLLRSLPMLVVVVLGLLA